jgi:pimeloyl-ACP methyl ester carboxylesterase
MKRRCFLAWAIATAALPSGGQDILREQRWKNEVLSNLVVGDAVRISLPSGSAFLGLYTQGRAGQSAVLLVHGAGVHPDHGVIGILRVALADRGYTTLSIQMPVLAADARTQDYLPLFPEAGERIAAAAGWLEARTQDPIVILSHSLGAWMTERYLESTKAAPFAAWICMGRSGALAGPAHPIPILDVYGEHDLALVLRYAEERRRALQLIPGSRQVMIPGADHFYTGKEPELTDALVPFIEAVAAAPR